MLRRTFGRRSSRPPTKADVSHVASLFSMLERALQARGDSGPLTVEEVYQRHLPYRTVRTELGIVEFATYERALLELFAGRGGHLHLTEPRAREELERELDSPNPILGLYRDYAHAGVRLGVEPDTHDVPPAEASPPSIPEPASAATAEGAAAPARAPASEAALPGGQADDPDREPGADRGVGDAPAEAADLTSPGGLPVDTAPTRAAAPDSDAGQENAPERPLPGDPEAAPTSPATGPSRPSEPAESPEGAGSHSSPARQCIECEQPLPADPELNFCPFCGRQQKPTECPECGLSLRPEWNFCIRCGTPIGD